MTPSLEQQRLVLGAAQLGQQYGRGADREPPDPAAAAALVRAAVDGGVVELDTARAYGASESVIGQALGTVGGAAARLRIVTKVRPLDDLSPDSDASDVGRSVRDSVGTSLGELRCDRVDTVLLHRARDLTAGGGAAVAALDALVAEGVTGRWGVSVGSPDDLLTACAVPGVRYLQLPFNLLDRRWLAEPVQQALARRPEIRIVARSVLLQGLLSSPEPGRWPAVPGVEVAAVQSGLAALVTDLGRDSTLDLAIGYALGQPWVDAVVLGVRRPDQLPAILQACAAPPLTAEQTDQLQQAIPPAPDDLIDPSRWAAYPRHE